MIVVQIIPRLSPPVDGVGDYALQLAHQLNKDFSIKTHFLIGDPNWLGGQEVDGFKISKVAEQTSEKLLSTLNDIDSETFPIILHYVGTGYARRGCPFWLVDGLAQYQAGSPRELVTMFHETYGSGPPYYGADPPWISAFWLAPFQKRIASRLVLMSSSCVTSRKHFCSQLKHLIHGYRRDFSIAPVFSNVGEAANCPAIKDRQPILVLFGGSRSRARVYEEFSAGICNTCKILEIEKIYDIGPSTNLNITEYNNVPVVTLGEKTTVEIGEILLSSRAGMLNYHPEFLAKSGMYAAYSAYGLIPIVASTNTVKVEDMDGLRAGEHYWMIDSITSKLNLEIGQTVSSNAYTWYQSHNLSVHAQIFANSIRSLAK
jgi:hypothetical protein